MLIFIRCSKIKSILKIAQKIGEKFWKHAILSFIYFMCDGIILFERLL